MDRDLSLIHIFRDIFPPATSDQLYALTETLRSFSERLTISDETADKLQRTFKGLFSILDLVRQGVAAVFDAFAPLRSGMGFFVDRFLTVTATIGDFLTGINDAAKKGEVFSKAVTYTHLFKNSPGDIFGKWLRFSAVLAQAPRAAFTGKDSFAFSRDLLSG